MQIPLFSENESEQTKEKMQMPLLWFRINKPELDKLTSDIYNNQNTKDLKNTKNTINKNTFDLKNEKKFRAKVTTSKTSRNEAKKLYKELIQKDIDALEREKSNSIKKNNILKILENIGAIFTGAYLHYEEVPKETRFERNIAERVKSRRQRLDIINKKKENINNELFNHYFGYLNPIIMLERLRNDESDEKNKDLVESINKKLTKMKNIVKNVPKDKVSRVEENEKIIDIVERILELNSEKQLGLGLKILTPNQILSRLPITLAQLKAGNNSEKLKSEIRQLLYSLYKSKKLTKNVYNNLINAI